MTTNAQVLLDVYDVYPTTCTGQFSPVFWGRKQPLGGDYPNSVIN